MALSKAKLLEIINSGALDSAIFLRQHPVGRIVMSTDSTNPGTIYGGTWVAWGSGRVPVGVDAAQAEFNAPEKTGGEKTHTLQVSEIPAHAHDERFGSLAGSLTVAQIATNLSIFGTNVPTSSVGGGGEHNNLQPYITCYMWKRTA